MSDSNEPEKVEGAPQKSHGVLYIGMDLGTSRTSVSASNGVRETVYSVVGYPKDVVSQKLLKKDVLFGKEALEKRLSLRMYKPLEKGVLKYSDGDDQDRSEVEKAARDLIREAIRLAQPRKDELVYAVIGAPAQASITNREAIIEAARATVDSVMLCSEPFAVAYGLDMLEDALVIDIGAGTTDLCRMHGTMPEESDQLTLTYAGDAVDRKLTELIQASCPGAGFTPQMVKDIKERHSFVGATASPVVVTLPVDGKPTQFDITAQVQEACSILVDPIVDGLRKLIATFDPEFQHRLRNRVLLAGGGSMIKGLDTAIEEAMNRDLGGGKVIRVEEPIYGGANGALKIAHDMPEEYWEQLK
ncbi:MAG: MamK family actin-like protein [Planctomycetota bacterium]|nr:MamK family actin-like protein [Planctomycetota bacterium]MDA0932360.1 MamK family actin-like protein [Planctomycetota bacterium]MDA1221163.1 MamK family actin-like protein [Planctomycetota bacterium]